MAPPSLVDRLQDMREAVARIRTLWNGRTEADYQLNLIDRLATERLLQIVTEAARHLPDDVTSKHPEIDWRRLTDFGNVLRHAYHRLDSTLVWTIIVSELPPLAAAIEAMIAEERGP